MDDFDQLLKNVKHNTDYLDTRAALSSAEKTRILNLTLENITQEIHSEKKGVIKMRKMKKRLPIILAATLGLGVASISAATLFHLKAPLAQSVNVTTNEADSIAVAGTDIMASSSQEGVTVNATQVIGDQYGFYVLLELSSPDFTSQNIDFEETNIEINGVDTLAWDFNTISYKDHTVYAVVNVRTPNNLINKDIHVTLSNLTSDNKNTKATWDLTWKLDYSDVSKEFAVNQMIDIYGGKAIFNSVYVSPLSVYVTLEEKEAFDTYGNFDDSITVKMRDGSVITSNSDNSYNDTTVIGLYLGKLTNLSDIQSVTFAGIEVPINSHFSIEDNGAAKKLVVSNIGNNESTINQLLQEDADAIINAFDIDNGQINMNIDYDYQEPNNRLVVTYTGDYQLKDGSYPLTYYAVSDIDLQKAERRTSVNQIDPSLIKEALHTGNFEINVKDDKLKKAQKDYVMNLSDEEFNAILSDVNFTNTNGKVTMPQAFMVDNEDTLMISLPAIHAIGDHIELTIMPQ